MRRELWANGMRAIKADKVEEEDESRYRKVGDILQFGDTIDRAKVIKAPDGQGSYRWQLEIIEAEDKDRIGLIEYIHDENDRDYIDMWQKTKGVNQ